eukprot:3034141-Ditylum_brightwellii.AAC.1
MSTELTGNLSLCFPWCLRMHPNPKRGYAVSLIKAYPEPELSSQRCLLPGYYREDFLSIWVTD